MKTEIDESNVVPSGIARRPTPDERPMLQPVGHSACIHFSTSFEIDVDGQKCKCLSCQAEVSPWFVLKRLMAEESRWRTARGAYLDQMKRLAERSRTKCDHCSQMTRISRT